jgi:hypothetical protein
MFAGDGLVWGVVGPEASLGFASVASLVTSADEAGALEAATGLFAYSIFCQQPASKKIGAMHKPFRIQCNITTGGDGVRSKSSWVQKRTLFHPIVARIEGEQQNGPISETRWSQAGHKVCEPAEEDGPEQESRENE